MIFERYIRCMCMCYTYFYYRNILIYFIIYQYILPVHYEMAVYGLLLGYLLVNWVQNVVCHVLVATI